jgi:ATP-dependent helicase/nuclease subunit A
MAVVAVTVFQAIVPTDAQRLASDPENSSWVLASAGSGKTHVLVDRMVRLMLHGTKPERIVCLTFTKAAAAEMSRRLFKTLSEWTGLNDAVLVGYLVALTGREQSQADISAARRLFASALETPGGLKIQTIHAFCERLLQRFPVEAGVVPGFQIVDERLQRQLLTAALDAVLAGRNEALADATEIVSRYLTAGSLEQLLLKLLPYRATLPIYAAKQVRNEVLAAALGVAPDDTMVRFAIEITTGLDWNGYRAAAEACKALALKQGSHLEGLLGAAAPDAALAHLRALFLTKMGEPRSEARFPPARLCAVCPASADFLAAESERLAPIFERGRRIIVLEATSALTALAAPIIGHYEDAKRTLGYFDYDDLIDKSLALLSDPERASWVLYKLDGGIDHLLIDEAQDTGREQWQIVQALTGEFFAGEGARSDVARSLFVVGDEKQCIFSFQGADPYAFAEMRRYFARKIGAAQGGDPELGLTVSFRSTKAVLEVVDNVFMHTVHEAHRADAPGLVELWPLETGDAKVDRDPWRAPLTYDFSDHPRRRLARRIARTVAGWIRQEAPLPGRGRAIVAGDILILVRHRTTLMDELVRALKIENLPVSGADRLTLASNIAVMDLLALGHAMLLPADDQMLACVLKSPLVGRDDGKPIGDDDLLVLARERGPRTLWRKLEAAAAGGGPYRTAAARFGIWREASGRRPPFEFFAQVLAEDRGRERFISRLGAQCGEPLDAFLNQCLEYEGGHAASLSGFLAWMEAEDTVLKRDMEQEGNQIRVMTVHGAKGLEANIVFLADTCDIPERRKDPGVLAAPVEHSGGRLDVPLWRVKIDRDAAPIAQLREQLRAKELAEYDRLLYVAMTRARDRLYICGCTTGSPDRLPPESWYRRTAAVLQEIGRSQTDAEGRTIWTYEGYEPGAGEIAETSGAASQSEPLPAWIDAPPRTEEPSPALLRPSSLTRAAEAIIPPLSAGAVSDRSRGVHIHRLLEMLPLLAPSERKAAALRYLAMPAHGLDNAGKENILDSALAVLDNEDFRDVFAPESLAEVAIAAKVRLPNGSEVPVTGRIDRLMVRENDVLIIDYKSNRPPPRTLDNIDPVYLWQLALYRLTLTSLYPAKIIRAAILWTEALKLMEIPASALEETLRGPRPTHGRRP